MKNTSLIKVICFGILMMISQGFAAEDHSKFNLGALGGLGTISSGTPSVSTNGFTWGGRVGYRFTPTWELGLEFNTMNCSNTIGTTSVTTVNSTMSLLMVDFDYHFGGDFNPLFLGVRAGVGFSSSSFTGAITGSSTPAT